MRGSSNSGSLSINALALGKLATSCVQDNAKLAVQFRFVHIHEC
jgi:hypothetical protein